ncbi:uncharacterized protein LOC144365482 isoform X2 [Ictidomys tridecemlineatus]
MAPLLAASAAWTCGHSYYATPRAAGPGAPRAAGSSLHLAEAWGQRGAFWSLCTRLAHSALSVPRKHPELAFPSGPPRLRGLGEKNCLACCLQPAVRSVPPVEVNSPHPFLFPARPPFARPRHYQLPDLPQSEECASAALP